MAALAEAALRADILGRAVDAFVRELALDLPRVPAERLLALVLDAAAGEHSVRSVFGQGCHRVMAVTHGAAVEGVRVTLEVNFLPDGRLAVASACYDYQSDVRAGQAARVAAGPDGALRLCPLPGWVPVRPEPAGLEFEAKTRELLSLVSAHLPLEAALD